MRGMKSVALIGLSGSGKSSLGRMAADALGMFFIDVDSEIERESGMPISRIFELHGEKFFRDTESRATAAAAVAAAATFVPTAVPALIATGGGVVLRSENIAALRKSCFIVFLDRPAEQIAKSLPRDGSRPLLKDSGAEQIQENLRAMEQARRPLYLAAADAVLEIDSGIDEALEKLIALLNESNQSGESGKSERPDEYAVIGEPVAHSLSPVIHGAVFAELGLTGRYSAIEVRRGELADFARLAKVSHLKGFNVTIPHKSAIIPLLDETDAEAALCGAVNTVVVRDGRLSGFNTDMGGLLESLREAGRDFRGSRVVILGAGGAARGAAFKAAREGALSVTLLSRRAEQARETAESVNAGLQRAGLHLGAALASGAAPASGAVSVQGREMSPEVMASEAAAADILINATPIGMSGVKGDFPVTGDAPARANAPSLEFLEAMPRGGLVYDLVYSPAETRLLKRASELGLTARNGLGMLIYQALLADELFLNRRLDKPALYKTVKEMLAK
jgi:shikimate dehydrogenase